MVTKGVFTSELYDRIKELRQDGKSETEIADTMMISESALNSYTPYKKGIYNENTPSKNAQNIRSYRKSKAEKE